MVMKKNLKDSRSIYASTFFIKKGPIFIIGPSECIYLLFIYLLESTLLNTSLIL